MRQGLSIKERLIRNRKIDEKTGCWLWTGTISRIGYGTIWIDGKTCLVHRIAYLEFIGSLKKLCLHKTICPNRHCFFPEHLYDGSRAENAQDAIKIGNNKELNKTHCRYGHEYSAENTGISSGGSRLCKICKNEWAKINNEKAKLKRKLERIELEKIKALRKSTFTGEIK